MSKPTVIEAVVGDDWSQYLNDVEFYNCVNMALVALGVDSKTPIEEARQNFRWGKRVRHTNVIDFYGWTASELLEKHLRREMNER